MRLTMTFLLALVLGQPAHAGCVVDIDISFREGAPRDQFVITNDSSADSIISIGLDLTASAGGLVFDTAEGGAGVEAFQPFRRESGDAGLAAMPLVADGSTALALQFMKFGPGKSYIFSIDVDDRLTQSDMGQIRVSDQEIDGALAIIGLRGTDGSVTTRQIAFSNANTAQIETPCP